MAKVLRCYDIGTNCDFTVRAETEEEVLRIAEEHGRKNHGMKDFSPEMTAKLKAFMVDE